MYGCYQPTNFRVCTSKVFGISCENAWKFWEDEKTVWSSRTRVFYSYWNRKFLL